MNSRLILRLFVTAALALIALTLFPTASRAAEQLYTCGMHPQIIKKEPGNCPICGMKLTPIHGSAGKSGVSAAPAPGERKIKYYKSTMTPGEVKPIPGKDSMGMEMVPVYEDEEASADNKIQIDTATTQRMNLKTALVEQGPVHREFRTVGVVAYNEEGMSDITTKYEGWIEKLYVNATWTVVKVGDPLFEIYSPDLYNAQLNYVTALRTEGGADSPLARSALTRLQLFDVPGSFIDELRQSGEAKRTFVFRAPTSGVVIEKMAVAGQMMKPGERIYRLADLSTVWIQAQVYEKELPFVQAGQAAMIKTSYGPERTFEGTVQMLLPQVQEQTRTATARIVLPNTDGFLRPGMFVDVGFSAKLADDAVLVPDMAVLRSGERNTVFVALEGGFFDPREVRLGARSDGNFYEVLSGLKAGERVVISGQFMLDSESQLRDAIQKMLRTAPGSTPATDEPAGASASENHAGHSDAKAVEPASQPGNASVTLYTCPMAEHADVVQGHPGKCPKCGMKLVPTGEVEHGAAAEKAWQQQHAEHANGIHQHTSLRTAKSMSPVDAVATVRRAYARQAEPAVAGVSILPASLKIDKAADSNCGGCGMSEASMANGEPCEMGKM